MTKANTVKSSCQPIFPGLTDAEVEESRRRHGANILTPPARTPWWKLYLEKFEDPIIRILLIAAVIALLAGVMEGHYAEGIGIILAVLLATTLGFINEYRAGKEFDILNQVSDNEPVKTIRHGCYTSVPKCDLVVGDILLLEQGEEIPADTEILSSVSFQINESSLTGESIPVTKSPREEAQEEKTGLAYPRHLAYRGTFVSDGHAIARITAVGDGSEIGRTARAAAEETETETPLNRQLARLSQVIGVCGFTIAMLIFSALTIKAAWLGQLDEHITIEHVAITSDTGQVSANALAAALDAFQHKYGTAATRYTVQTRATDDTKEYYLQLPLSSGQIYLLVIAIISALIAILRVWLPVYHDAIELTGRKRPENAWLERKDIWPWIQTLIAAAITFGIGAGIGIAAGWMPSSPSLWLPASTGLALLGYFMVAVTIIVVAVPEGLPMSVTLSLAYSMRKMTAENNLVRRMHACETIGAATVICSDKTGTLTMNQMRVASHAFYGLPPSGFIPKEAAWHQLVEAIAANSTANLGEDGSGRLSIPLGNPTEAALLLWLEGHGIDYREIRDGFAMTGQLTFSTEHKYMATLGVRPISGETLLYAKGAPEIMLGHCTSRQMPDGEITPLTESDRESLLAALKSEQARGMRTLGFAYRRPEGMNDEPPVPAELVQELVAENSLVWMGFFSIADPVRPDVSDAIIACRNAGVGVKMVTGDTEATAREIAVQAGMLDRDDTTAGLIMTGDDFMAMDDKTAEQAAATLRIMSRAKPLAKQRLVSLLQKKGEVVAVTGDGSNDAPALNHANVGLAMGITGTAVAKEAADIILLDDSFSSIVRAIMWGRSLYANIQKFILFQLTINVTALGIALLGPFLGIQLPLTVTQMLWVNLIMDTFAALALASEPPDWQVMKKQPRNPEAFIVTPSMGKFIFITSGAFLALFLALVLGFGTLFPMDADTAQGRHNLSIFFSVFVFLQLWNLFNARMLGKTRSALAQLSGSHMFLLIVLTICAGQILITQFGGSIFRTSPLSIREWAWIIVGTSPVLWIGEIIRCCQRMKTAPENG